MNAIINKTGNVIQKIIWGILVAMFGILSIFNILGTTKIDIKVNDYKEYAEYSLNNILMIILYVVTIFAILYIIDRYTKLLKMDTNKFANIATIYVIAIGIAYIVMVRAYPISDQSVVQRIASSFLDGDYSELTGKGYLVAYPQQLGIIGIIQIILCRGNSLGTGISPDDPGHGPGHHAEPDGRPQRLHPLLRHHLRGAQRHGLPGRALPGGQGQSEREDGDRLHPAEEHGAGRARRNLPAGDEGLLGAAEMKYTNAGRSGHLRLLRPAFLLFAIIGVTGIIVVSLCCMLCFIIIHDHLRCLSATGRYPGWCFATISVHSRKCRQRLSG